MKSAPPRAAKPQGLRPLLHTCARLPFEPHDIAHQIDARGRYDVPLADEFPLLIKLFHYTSAKHTRGETWHERLELFLPLDGHTRLRMGRQEARLNPGDLLVVDNLKLHHVVDFPGFDSRVVVISFLPELVYSLGSPTHDYVFLLPFYSQTDQGPHILRAQDPAAPGLWAAVHVLLTRYFGAADPALQRAGCKAALLDLLYHLAGHLAASEVLRWEFLRQQQRSLRLKPLFDHIRDHYSERITVAEAARLAHLSAPQLARTFKRVAGMTLVAYVNHVRLANAARFLKETQRSIADIAIATGFADQSYFDKRFKRAFGQSPRDFRQGRVPLPP